MTARAIKQSPGNIGRLACIRVPPYPSVGGHFLYGNCIDQVAGTTEPKRIRVQWGDPNLKGCVLGLGQYSWVAWADEESE